MALISNSQPTRIRYGVLAWLCVATTIAYVDRGSVSVAEPEVRTDLGLTSRDMGYVMGGFFVTYALFQVPAARLDQWLGTRRSLPLFAAGWSLATALCAMPGGLPVLIAARLLMGATEAGIFPVATAVVGRWFPAKRRAGASGVLAAFMGVGGALGAALSGAVLGIIPWQAMFILYAIPGLVWAIGFWYWFRDSPAEHPAVNLAERQLIAGDSRQSVEGQKPPATGRLWNPAVGWLTAQQFFRAAGAIFYFTWFPTYLRETRGVSVVEAGLLASLPLWANVAGSVAGGWLSDKMLAFTGTLRAGRQGVAVASMVGAAILIGAAQFVTDATPAVLVLSAGSFVASLAGPCAYALTIDLGGPRTASVFGAMNTAGAVASALFPIIVPHLVNITESWNSVLWMFAGIHLTAAGCWMLIDADRFRYRESI